MVLAIGAAVAFDLTNADQDPPFDPNKVKAADLALFAGFFLAAAAIERILELIAPAIPWWNYPDKTTAETFASARTTAVHALAHGSTPPADSASGAAAGAREAVVDVAIKQKKADRGYAILGLATLLGVLASGTAGLYLLQAVGMSAARWVDMLITAIAVSGGTKGLHELIKTLQKAKGPGTAG